MTSSQAFSEPWEFWKKLAAIKADLLTRLLYAQGTIPDIPDIRHAVFLIKNVLEWTYVPCICSHIVRMQYTFRCLELLLAPAGLHDNWKTIEVCVNARAWSITVYCSTIASSHIVQCFLSQIGTILYSRRNQSSTDQSKGAEALIQGFQTFLDIKNQVYHSFRCKYATNHELSRWWTTQKCNEKRRIFET